MSPLMVGGLLTVLGLWYVATRNYLLDAPSLFQPLTVSYAWSIMATEEKINALMNAIAHAEGFFAGENSLPKRCNNPGDLKETPQRFMSHVVGTTPNGILIFDSASAGWDALRFQVTLMLTGKSHVYSLSDSLLDVGEHWARENASDPAGATWAKNVASVIGCDVSVTLAELAA